MGAFDLVATATADPFAGGAPPVEVEEAEEQPRRRRRSHLPEQAWLDVDRDELLRALGAVKPACNARSAVEALGGVRVVSDAEGAHVWATDLTAACRRALPWQDGSEEGFDALVNHVALVKAAKTLAAGDVRLEAVDEGARCGLRLVGGRRTITLTGLRAEDYPAAAPFAPGRVLARAEGRTLAAAIKRALVCTSKDETRPILTGLYIDAAAGLLVSTDSYRLSVIPVALDVPEAIKAEHAVNVPGGPLGFATKAMRMADRVTIGTGTAGRGLMPWVVVDCGEETWSVRTIDGQFPKWEQLIPEEGGEKIRVNVDRLALADSASAADALLTHNEPLRVRLDPARGQRHVMRVIAQSPDGPSMEDELTVDATWLDAGDGQQDYGFNPTFLGQLAGALTGERIDLRVISPLRPLTLVDEEGGLGLLMPVRLNV